MACCTRTTAPVFVAAIVAGLATTGVFGLYMSNAIERETEPPALKAAPDTTPDSEDADPAYVLDHTMNLIDGTEQELAEYEGDVVLLVNVASRCGLTPQYEALQELFEQKREKGFTILAFPANDFRGQEPGTNEEIAEFCTDKFGVTFPMFEKISVLGDERHPLYAQLAEIPQPAGGEPQWNFHKFLVDRSGHVVASYDPRTGPLDADLTDRIDELLEQ